MTRIGLATLAVLLVTPLPAWSASVAIFEPPGARATQVADINNAGQVVGFVFDQPTSNGHNFIRQADGSFITIANLNTATIGAISDAGQIVGRLNSQSFIGSPTSAPGIYSVTTFQPFGANFSEATGLNEHGQIVGNVALGPSSFTVPYIRQPDGTVQIININGNVQGINNAGTIAGNRFEGGGFIGTATTVPGQYTITPFQAGAVSSFVTGMNNRGDVVGFAFDNPQISTTHGFLREVDGTIRKSDILNSRFDGINDSGLIVGQLPTGGRLQGFLISAADLPQPIPEPTSIQLILIGAVILLVVPGARRWFLVPVYGGNLPRLDTWAIRLASKATPGPRRRATEVGSGTAVGTKSYITPCTSIGFWGVPIPAKPLPVSVSSNIGVTLCRTSNVPLKLKGALQPLQKLGTLTITEEKFQCIEKSAVGG